MNCDINIKQLQKNCWRQSKVPGEFMLQLRVPGSLIEAKHLEQVIYIANTWGNGLFHVGMRHTLNVPGVKYENIPAVNAYIKDYISQVENEMCGVEMEESENGYPTIGARNIMACIGNRHCILANYNTQELAKKIEPLIFPSHYHIKIGMSGCPNDCGKGQCNDFGIIGQAKMDYVYDRCIGCGQCVDACKKHATGVLSLTEDKKVAKDTCCCLGCGECAVVCPAGAWVRQPKKFFRITIGGRTGKHTPRLGKTFINFATEEVVLGVLGNWQKFSAWVLDYKPVYMHGGHLIDMAGYEKFKEMILDGVELNPEAKVAQRIMWAESEMRGQINVIPIGEHPVAGPQQ
ncbi:sulfite reductase subunit C [Bittarella massiliensis (ex Durand et al. 2017)]|uniref:Sulfite reductase subunit C n=1 Tax=Bittarella massiliensis (ex Durand et al. 2017) TaxID=1720313 RepID=A0AAW5K6A6_9FIRM|nr:sulfite reductase subunit C [Bittarella massiliensis (ex Durand et al. 2017)]MCQ4948138.1 sulfite reductase subunit C [Bittarella massiliensis (ex Durand et al. 2017)]